MLKEPLRPHIKHQRGLWAPREHTIPGARPALSAGRLAPETTAAPSPLHAAGTPLQAWGQDGRLCLPGPPTAGRAERQTGKDSSDTAGGRAEVGTEVGPAPREEPQGPRVCQMLTPRQEDKTGGRKAIREVAGKKDVGLSHLRPGSQADVRDAGEVWALP